MKQVKPEVAYYEETHYNGHKWSNPFGAFSKDDMRREAETHFEATGVKCRFRPVYKKD